MATTLERLNKLLGLTGENKIQPSVRKVIPVKKPHREYPSVEVKALCKSSDPRILEMKAIQSRNILQAKDFVPLLEKQGYPITYAALAQVMQGNVLGTDIRTNGSNSMYSRVGRKIKLNHVDDLLIEYRKIDVDLEPARRPFCNKGMREIIDGWYYQTGITGAAREKQLSKIIGCEFTTIWRWHSDNRYPRSLMSLLELQRKVDGFLENTKTPLCHG